MRTARPSPLEVAGDDDDDPLGERPAQPGQKAAPAHDFRLVLLDCPRLGSDGGTHHLPSRSLRLVALLALRGRLSRSLAAGYLWPEVSEARARASVRAAVRDLQLRAPSLLRATSADIELDDAVEVDVRGLRAVAHALLTPEPDDGTLAAGLELTPGGAFGGELLPGWPDDWAVAEAERLHQLRLHALDALVDHLTGRRRHAQALEVALATISADPLRESTHRAVMRVFLAEGNTVEALRQYERFRAMVRVEMGIEPSRQMVDLVNEITANRGQQATLSVVRRKS